VIALLVPSALLRCPLCGVGAGALLVALLVAAFVLIFGGMALLFWASWRRGDWSDGRARFAPLEAEEGPR
jgi:hypothetical protein